MSSQGHEDDEGSMKDFIDNEKFSPEIADKESDEESSDQEGEIDEDSFSDKGSGGVSEDLDYVEDAVESQQRHSSRLAGVPTVNYKDRGSKKKASDDNSEDKAVIASKKQYLSKKIEEQMNLIPDNKLNYYRIQQAMQRINDEPSTVATSESFEGNYEQPERAISPEARSQLHEPDAATSPSVRSPERVSSHDPRSMQSIIDDTMRTISQEDIKETQEERSQRVFSEKLEKLRWENETTVSGLTGDVEKLPFRQMSKFPLHWKSSCKICSARIEIDEQGWGWCHTVGQGTGKEVKEWKFVCLRCYNEHGKDKDANCDYDGDSVAESQRAKPKTLANKACEDREMVARSLDEAVQSNRDIKRLESLSKQIIKDLDKVDYKHKLGVSNDLKFTDEELGIKTNDMVVSMFKMTNALGKDLLKNISEFNFYCDPVLVKYLDKQSKSYIKVTQKERIVLEIVRDTPDLSEHSRRKRHELTLVMRNHSDSHDKAMVEAGLNTSMRAAVQESYEKGKVRLEKLSQESEAEEYGRLIQRHDEQVELRKSLEVDIIRIKKDMELQESAICLLQIIAKINDIVVEKLINSVSVNEKVMRAVSVSVTWATNEKILQPVKSRHLAAIWYNLKTSYAISTVVVFFSEFQGALTVPGNTVLNLTTHYDIMMDRWTEKELWKKYSDLDTFTGMLIITRSINEPMTARQDLVKASNEYFMKMHNHLLIGRTKADFIKKNGTLMELIRKHNVQQAQLKGYGDSNDVIIGGSAKPEIPASDKQSTGMLDSVREYLATLSVGKQRKLLNEVKGLAQAKGGGSIAHNASSQLVSGTEVHDGKTFYNYKDRGSLQATVAQDTISIGDVSDTSGIYTRASNAQGKVSIYPYLRSSAKFAGIMGEQKCKRCQGWGHYQSRCLHKAA